MHPVSRDVWLQDLLPNHVLIGATTVCVMRMHEKQGFTKTHPDTLCRHMPDAAPPCACRTSPGTAAAAAWPHLVACPHWLSTGRLSLKFHSSVLLTAQGVLCIYEDALCSEWSDWGCQQCSDDAYTCVRAVCICFNRGDSVDGARRALVASAVASRCCRDWRLRQSGADACCFRSRPRMQHVTAHQWRQRLIHTARRPAGST